jgi:uncharacterized RmlC-like cupin family protein
VVPRKFLQEKHHLRSDFILIRPDVPHQPINLNATKPALAIVARNDPKEQESVVHYGGRAQYNDPLKPDCHFHAATQNKIGTV